MADHALTITIEGVSPPGASCGPYTDVAVGLQVRKDVTDIVSADRPATFRAEVRVDPDAEGGPAWRGPAIHGPRGEKFLYLAWIGRLDGAHPAGFRRAKLQLDAVPADVLAEAIRTGGLVATVRLTDAKGMPTCASVRPPTIAWRARGSTGS